jgi:threonine/homoserine/homoserine lactone efflux protein
VELAFFIKGLILGFIICVPFGPIGLLCVMRTLTDGKLAGIASVLGASVMDAIYCAIGGLGVSYVSNFLNKESSVLRWAGVSLFKPQLTLNQLRLANRIAGVILFGFGVVTGLLALLR